MVMLAAIIALALGVLIVYYMVRDLWRRGYIHDEETGRPLGHGPAALLGVVAWVLITLSARVLLS